MRMEFEELHKGKWQLLRQVAILCEVLATGPGEKLRKGINQ